MRQIWLLFALLLVSGAAYGQTTVVQGHLKLPDTTAPSNAKVCVTLQNFKPNVARVIGTGEIISTSNYCTTLAADGSYSFNIYANNTITPTATNWRVDFLFNGIQVSSATYLINHSPFNLDTETPLSSSTPAGPNQLILNVFPFTQLTPTTTWTIPHNFNDPNTIALVSGLNGNDIVPDSKNCRTDPNNCIVTFITPTSGFAIALHAAQISITSDQPNAIVSNPIGSQSIGGASPLNISAPVSFSGPGTHTGLEVFTGTTTACRLGNVRFVDALNTCIWPGTDFGAWVNSAIADLPSVTSNSNSYKQGKIVLGPSGNLAVTQSTTAIVGAFVGIEGPGAQQLILSCTMNADCWQVRDTPWGNNRGSRIGGFTLLGTGSANANAVGMHVGDLNSERFENINIDNFLGTNSSCFWVDNQNGWFERNNVSLELGAHTEAAGEIESGCTKLARFTTSANPSSISFNGNHWDVRMSLKASGQIGWSLEPTNPFNFYNCTILGNANMVAGSILFKINPATNGAGTGCWIDFKAESTGAATGWSTAASPPTPFTYLGPGIGRNGGSTAITDSIGANSLVNLNGITQTASVAGCQTGAVQFNFCDSTLTWPLPFADTNYQVTCNGDGFAGTVGVLQGADMNGAKSTTSVNARTVTLNASQFQFTLITCTGTRQGL